MAAFNGELVNGPNPRPDNSSVPMTVAVKVTVG